LVTELGYVLRKCTSDSWYGILRAPKFMKYVNFSVNGGSGEPCIHPESTYLKVKSPILMGLAREGQNIGRFSINPRGSGKGGFGGIWDQGWYTRGKEMFMR